MGSPSSGGGYGSPTSGYGSPLASGTMYGGGGFSGQQPAYGMGTGGQYSPQLRQAQTAWQQQAGRYGIPGAGGQQQDLSMMSDDHVGPYGNTWGLSPGQVGPPPMTLEEGQQRMAAEAANPGEYMKQQAAQSDAYTKQLMINEPWRVNPNGWLQPAGSAQQPMMQNPMIRQPYGMGAQGMGNAYGYGGQQGNPWGAMTTTMPAGWEQAAAQTRIAQANNPLTAPWLTGNQPPPAQPFGVPMQQPAAPPAAPVSAPPAPPPPPPAPPPSAMSQATFNVNNLPRGSYQIGGYNGGTPAPAAAPPPRPAAPTRANYSPSNPYGGMYSNPQADAWEQQQRSGGLPPPVAPQTDVMRKALSGVDNGYGYGTPGGYQLDTAPSTLDPGSMNGLLGFLGGNINGVGYPTSAANYANWYQQTYGQQAPGGPRAYPF